jgi:diguanylate cyclase (GGDEF)-like protein
MNTQNIEQDDNKRSRGIGLKWLSVLLAILTVLVSILLLLASYNISESYKRQQDATEAYISGQILANQLKQGSDNLTTDVRSFVVTGKTKFLEYYCKELTELKTYDNAYNELKPLLKEDNLLSSLKMINDYEDKLKQSEAKAILMAMDYYGITDQKYRDCLGDYSLTSYEEGLSLEDKHNKAISLAFGGDSELVHYGDYDMYKKIVNDNIDSFIKQLASVTHNEQAESMKQLDNSVFALRRMTIYSMLFLMLMASTILNFVVRPLLKNIGHINSHDYLEEEGVYEIKYLATSYNQMMSKVNDNQKKLSYEASHDALTGLLNRQAYLDNIRRFEEEKICFLHMDADNFKHVNDTYGHDVGDMYLQKIARVLVQSFRKGDEIYRLGGDEFAVIMDGITESSSQIVTDKVKLIEDAMLDGSDGLPTSAVSFGATFYDGSGGVDKVYKEADLALYVAKNSGKGKLIFYDESMAMENPEKNTPNEQAEVSA